MPPLWLAHEKAGPRGAGALSGQIFLRQPSLQLPAGSGWGLLGAQVVCEVYKYDPDRPRHSFGSKEGFKDIEECKALCAATLDGEFAQCTGIEWSVGRCEIWQVMIEATNPNVAGFTCLKFQL